MQIKILILLFLLPGFILAQNDSPVSKKFTGVWAGEMVNITTGSKNNFELAISDNKGKLSGFTYTIFFIHGKKNIGVKTVKIKEKKDLLFVEDDKLINDNYEAPPAKGVRTFIELHYTKNDTSEFLSGSWKSQY